jgi:hypothetical protein
MNRRDFIKPGVAGAGAGWWRKVRFLLQDKARFRQDQPEFREPMYFRKQSRPGKLQFMVSSQCP